MTSPAKLVSVLGEAMAGQGFGAWGVAAAGPLDEAHGRLLGWIRSGRHGPLSYMHRRAPLLRDPGHPGFLPGARSIVMVLVPFARPDPPVGSLGLSVARHARGRDYHDVVGSGLRSVLGRLVEAEPGLRGRVFVDSAPVMEKPWAQRAGLGWIGLGGLLVRPGAGTRSVLGGIAVDREIEPGEPAADGCGSCRACIDACPVGALSGDRLVDAARCLSCLTVERRRPLDEDEVRLLAGRSAFGCDLCQDACPFNDAVEQGGADFDPLPFMGEMTPEDFLALDALRAGRLLEGTAIARTGLERFRESLAASLSRVGDRGVALEP